MTIEPPFTLRKATLDDIPTLERLIADSVRTLGRQDYTDAQIEAALGTVWGVDTQLILDETYFVAEGAGEIAACGGWSRRSTLFGADTIPGRSPELLDPANDAARIRAFFVRPDWARKGIGRALIDRCEAEAKAYGFRSVEMVATLTGQRLYLTCGYTAGPRIPYDQNGTLLDFVSMRKDLM